jgi:hypothetical protein
MMKFKMNLTYSMLKAILSGLIVCIGLTGNCQSNTLVNTNRKGKTVSAENSDTAKKVLIHYMGWFGDTIPDDIEGDIERHWRFGHANTPQIGYYDSKNRSLLTYHLLLSWSCGIDGIVINVKDAYDDSCMRSLIRTIKWIRSIDSVNFNYDFGISYDDQGFDITYPYDTTINKLSYLRDSILPELPNYLTYKGRPAIFVFDYPEKYLTANDFRNVLNTVFQSDSPILIWNSLDDKENSATYTDAFYPWVQPGNKGWDKNGLNWGKEFLDWYYPKVNEINTYNQYIFTCGGVWAGFDDRKNTSWGGNRLIDREEGRIYDSTWSYILNYNMLLPLDWVVIETWNDWNEGTEIEPSIEDGYKYLVSTTKNINAFKGSSIAEDIIKFEAARKIYEASLLIENGVSDTRLYNSMLEEAIRYFLQKEFDHSIYTATSIINLVTK